MTLQDIKERWAKYTLETWETKDVNWLIQRVEELEDRLQWLVMEERKWG